MNNLTTNNQKLMNVCIEQDFAEASNYTDKSSFFEFFSAEQLLKDYNLSDSEIESGIVDGGLDGGCDGLYLFLNGDLITADQISDLYAAKGSSLCFTIIQSKYVNSFKEDAIQKLKTVSENLLDMTNDIDSFKTRYNESVRMAFCLFRDALTKLIRSQVKVKFCYYYVTLASEVHPNVTQQAEELRIKVRQLYPAAQVEFRFIGADELMELYNKDSDICLNLSLSDTPISLGRNVEYVALVNLATYYHFISDENGALRKRLFESNVRDYQGKNSVNSCIAESLASTESEDFWWLNNGVTILAQNITQITTRELTLQNPEIVNGLQTSTEIYNFFTSNQQMIEQEKRNVLVRVIVPESEEVRDKIIFATNNQTNIPKSSLRVTDTIHLQIEMYFKSRGLYYDRRKNYYKNQKKKSTDTISLSKMINCR